MVSAHLPQPLGASGGVKGSFDLSVLVGTKLYVGYGVGSASLNPRAAHDSLLNNDTYKLVYTLE